jgi:hypothetical protein
METQLALIAVEIKNVPIVSGHFLLQRKAGITIADKAQAIRSRF